MPAFDTFSSTLKSAHTGATTGFWWDGTSSPRGFFCSGFIEGFHPPLFFRVRKSKTHGTEASSKGQAGREEVAGHAIVLR